MTAPARRSGRAGPRRSDRTRPSIHRCRHRLSCRGRADASSIPAPARCSGAARGAGGLPALSLAGHVRLQSVRLGQRAWPGRRVPPSAEPLFDRGRVGFCKRPGADCQSDAASISSDGMSIWHRTRSGRFADWRLAMKSILVFWLVYAATIVARAFLGTDPITALRNKAIIVVAGVVLTVAVYLAINLFARHSNIRRKAVVAALASFAAAVAQASILLFSDRFKHESKEEFRYKAREGFRHHREGQRDQDRAEGRRAPGADLARHARARPVQAAAIRRRHARSPGSSSSPPGAPSTSPLCRRRRRFARSAAPPTPNAPPRPRRSARCAIRSTRTSCSTRSTRCRR